MHVHVQEVAKVKTKKTEMKLLARHLRRHRPCTGGIKWFERMFPRGIDLCDTEQVGLWLRGTKDDAGEETDEDEVGEPPWLCDVLVLLVMVRPSFVNVRAGACITKLGVALAKHLCDPLDDEYMTEDVWDGLMDLPENRLVKAAGEIWKAVGPTFVRKRAR